MTRWAHRSDVSGSLARVAALAVALSAATVAVLSQGGATSGGARRDDAWSKVVRFYHERLQKDAIAGSSLMLIEDGRPTSQQFEGYQDLEKKTPIDRDTIFHWASITKTFTAIAIMQLRDRHLLALDDPAVKYVPELAQAHNPFGDMSQVTIRQLMSHSSGFRMATWPWGGDQPWHPFEPTRWEQLVSMMPYTELLFRPGSKYSYSNPGFIFLGRVIEALAGEDYEVYVTKNVLMPLGMRRTFFDRAPYHLVKFRSHSYLRTDAGLKEAPFDFDTGITVSNGGLNAPLDDMAKYIGFLIGDPARAGEYGTVLARSSLDEMFAPVIRVSGVEGAGAEDVQMALAFFAERRQGLDLIGHSGGQNGFISHFYLHRPSRTAYIVAFNTDASSKAAGDRQITRQLDADLRDLIVKEVFVPRSAARLSALKTSSAAGR